MSENVTNEGNEKKTVGFKVSPHMNTTYSNSMERFLQPGNFRPEHTAAAQIS